jgi:hypothetical protein
MAINDIGKNIAVARLTDGSLLNFFNHTLVGTTDKEIIFYDMDDEPRYVMTIDQSAIDNKYRCAHFSRSFAQAADENVNLNMLMMIIDNNIENKDKDIPVQPLYEFISPSIMSVKQDTIQLSWWSNVNASQLNENNRYKTESLIRFSSDNLFVNNSTTVCKVLCTALVRWEYLRQEGGGIQDGRCKLYPIIETPVIVSVVKNEGYVLDFDSGGGDGGGIGIHSHTSNDDGGFAASVFMPSAHIRPLNWR